MPVFAREGGGLLEFELLINDYSEAEIGLLLLVLKDLWHGDLAIGGEKNVGRGVFQGLTAEISWENGGITIENDLSSMSKADAQILQHFIEALIAWRENDE